MGVERPRFVPETRRPRDATVSGHRRRPAEEPTSHAPGPQFAVGRPRWRRGPAPLTLAHRPAAGLAGGGAAVAAAETSAAPNADGARTGAIQAPRARHAEILLAEDGALIGAHARRPALGRGPTAAADAWGGETDLVEILFGGTRPLQCPALAVEPVWRSGSRTLTAAASRINPMPPCPLGGGRTGRHARRSPRAHPITVLGAR